MIKVAILRMIDSSCLFTSESRYFLHLFHSIILNRQSMLDSWMKSPPSSSKKFKMLSRSTKKGTKEKNSNKHSYEKKNDLIDFTL